MAIYTINHDYVRVGASVDTNELKELSNSSDSSVRRRVAENNSCPIATLKKLSRDPDCEVRVAVAEHMKTPRYILMNLCEDLCVDVRYAIACAPARYAGVVLAKLLEDENPYVVFRAQTSLSQIQSVA